MTDDHFGTVRLRARARLSAMLSGPRTPDVLEALELAASGLAITALPLLPGRTLPPSIARTNAGLLAALGIAIGAQDVDDFAREVCAPFN